MSEEKDKKKISDGISLQQGEVIVHFTFDEFNCITERLVARLQKSRAEVRQLLIKGDLKLADIFEDLDYCTLEEYKLKRFREIMEKI